MNYRIAVKEIGVLLPSAGTTDTPATQGIHLVQTQTAICLQGKKIPTREQQQSMKSLWHLCLAMPLTYHF